MIVYYLIYPLSCLVGWLPRWGQSGLSALIRWFIYTLFGYRVKVVRENLRNSFPQYSESQRREIEKKFYTHLADVFVETMVLASISERNMRKRMKFMDYDKIEKQTEGRSFIAATAHYGSWEFTSSYGIYTSHEKVYGVYRPLANKGFDRYFLKSRSRFGSTPIPMMDIAQEVFRQRHAERGVVVALIADQAPPRYDDGKWFNFLNQPTQFFLGTGRLAQKLRLPVYFMKIERVKRGYYQADFELLYDGKEAVSEYEITRRYAQRLEQMICACPEIWMWSHRRWKRKPTSDEIEIYELDSKIK